MDFLNIICCTVIIVFGLVVFGLLISSMGTFRSILAEFGNIEVVSNRYEEKLGAQGDVKIVTPTEVEYDRKKLEENRVSFHRFYAGYVVYSQWVSLFPLLGILGTVLGLVLHSDFYDVEGLVSGLSGALWTTLWGLICSIVLKFFDAIGPGRMINEIDARFNAVDGAIDRLTMEQRIREEVSAFAEKESGAGRSSERTH